MSNTRRVRRSFTLSPEAVAALRALQGDQQTASASEALNRLLLALRSERRRRTLESAVRRYYDQLGPAEPAEEEAWGELGKRGLAALER